MPKGNPKRQIGHCLAADCFRLECGFLYNNRQDIRAGRDLAEMQETPADGRNWKEAEERWSSKHAARDTQKDRVAEKSGEVSNYLRDCPSKKPTALNYIDAFPS